LPPQNEEAEISVLGAILQDSNALLVCLDMLQPEDFYKRAHQKIYAACQTIFERQVAIDLVTMANELMRVKALEEVGGASYLASLVDAVPTAANITHHANIVKSKAILRTLITKGTGVVSKAYADSEDVTEIVEWAEQQIFAVGEQRIGGRFLPVRAHLKETLDLIEKLYHKKTRITGVPTGFTEFDELTAGLQKSDLIIVAGRPGMGKTAFALNIAQHVAVKERLPVAFFSIEMSHASLIQRMLCAAARVNSHRMRTGFLYEADWPKLTQASMALGDAPLYVDDPHTTTLLEMRAKARRLKAECDLALVAVDYLQLITGRMRTENRQQEISEISRGLKAMAKELNVPVLALSQLSRAVELRQPPRPQLSGLRESGAIEQDADVVTFLYRPGYYTQMRGKGNGNGNGDLSQEPDDNTTEVIVAKQRNGPTDTIRLAYLKEYTLFEHQERTRESVATPY
jgi:replicative DNA helicase